MKIIYANDYDEMSQIAKDLIKQELLAKKHLNLGLATGSTPQGLYKYLIADQDILWQNVTTFNLDEYVGLEPQNPQSYHFYMNRNFFDHININKSNTYIPLGVGDLKKNVQNYNYLIEQKGGIDLQILGIGTNGHIAFNEPGLEPSKKTYIVDLSPTTIEANAKYFDNINNVPTQAITMGIHQILQARKIILLASGLTKAKAIQKMIEEPININLPASYLQNHSNVTIIIDQAAARQLKNLKNI